MSLSLYIVGTWGGLCWAFLVQLIRRKSPVISKTPSTYDKVYGHIRRTFNLGRNLMQRDIPVELSYQSGEFSTKPKRFDGISLNTVAVLMDSEPAHPAIAAGDHKGYMKYALEQARRSPPLSTNFCVGAVLLDADKNEILSTGYTLELPGNTHAEQCCFIKVAQAHHIPEERLGEVLPRNTVLYTTMEPCNKRLSGNKTCVEKILGLKGAVKTVYVGIKEPEKFVGQNEGRKRLEDAGIVVTAVEGLADQILEVSTAGHETVNK